MWIAGVKSRSEAGVYPVEKREQGRLARMADACFIHDGCEHRIGLPLVLHGFLDELLQFAGAEILESLKDEFVHVVIKGVLSEVIRHLIEAQVDVRYGGEHAHSEIRIHHL